MNENFKTLLHPVKAFFFDVDGVLTDGTILIMADGDLLRSMNIRDGYAMKLAQPVAGRDGIDAKLPWSEHHPHADDGLING